jgi:hypothetical protein
MVFDPITLGVVFLAGQGIKKLLSQNNGPGARLVLGAPSCFYTQTNMLKENGKSNVNERRTRNSSCSIASETSLDSFIVATSRRSRGMHPQTAWKSLY